MKKVVTEPHEILICDVCGKCEDNNTFVLTCLNKCGLEYCENCCVVIDDVPAIRYIIECPNCYKKIKHLVKAIIPKQRAIEELQDEVKDLINRIRDTINPNE